MIRKYFVIVGSLTISMLLNAVWLLGVASRIAVVSWLSRNICETSRM